MAVSHPPSRARVRHSRFGRSLVVGDRTCAPTLMPLARAAHARFVAVDDALRASPADGLPHLGPNRRAMIIYTSGTTGRPKGVVTTHQIIGAQIASLVEAWRWTPADHLLLVLPLHHVHGIINGLGSALAVRATCEILPPSTPRRSGSGWLRGRSPSSPRCRRSITG